MQKQPEVEQHEEGISGLAAALMEQKHLERQAELDMIKKQSAAISDLAMLLKE